MLLLFFVFTLRPPLISSLPGSVYALSPDAALCGMGSFLQTRSNLVHLTRLHSCSQSMQLLITHCETHRFPEPEDWDKYRVPLLIAGMTRANSFSSISFLIVSSY